MEYQLIPYEFYTKDYFMLKALQYILPYVDDELKELAIEEAVNTYKLSKSSVEENLSELMKKI